MPASTTPSVKSVHGPVTMREAFTSAHPRFMRFAYILVWLVGLAAAWHILLAILFSPPAIFGQDSHAYWNAAQGDLEYSRLAGRRDAYLYSPAFLTLISPLTWMPWPVFQTVWVAILVTVTVWLVKPTGWKWGVPLFLCAIPEIYVSNIHILLAASAVIGMRYSAAWTFPVLTKITTGVGLVWFLVRGEWRQLGLGVGTTAAIVAASYAIDPAGWNRWVEFLLINRDGTEDGLSSLVGRAIVAVAIVALGAKINWPWVIPVAMYFSAPVLVSLIPLAILLSIPRLLAAPVEPADHSQAAPAS